MKQHISYVASKATTQCLAIKRLKGLAPRVTRQLYTSTVTSITDYAASTWYRPKLQPASRFKRILDAIQRLGAQAITGAFKTVSLSILEAEAGLTPTDFRLRKRVLNHWASMHTLPDNHPFWRCQERLHHQGSRYPSPFTSFSQEYQGIGQNLERIVPVPRAPYQAGLDIKIEPDRENAKAEVRSLQNRWTYWTDGSSRNQLVGAAVVTLNSQGQTMLQKNQTIAYYHDSNPYAAELQAIDLALRAISELSDTTNSTTFTYIIATDSQGALKSLAKPHQQSGQSTILNIFRRVIELKGKGLQIRFQWVPAHEGILGNEQAHQAALRATAKGRTIDSNQYPARLRSAAVRDERQRIQRERLLYFQNEPFGLYTRTLDQALPQRHTLKLYNKLSAGEANILIQLRSGHIGIGKFLHRIKKLESARCRCGYPEESVRHFLIECPRWTQQRRIINRAADNRYSDLSYLLGGWQAQKNRNGQIINGLREKWNPKIEVIKAVINFVRETGRLTEEA